VNRPRRRDPGAELLDDFAEMLPGARWRPMVDVFETEKAVVVRVELAGVRAGDLRVSVDGEWLRIRGERHPPPATDALRLHRMEIAFGPFERSVHISVPFEREQVAANLEEGFLSVVLPKRGSKRRRIAVQGEDPSGQSG
jgi:HSP20 family molecular chaperone IbpA